jgi:hypothetical protein
MKLPVCLVFFRNPKVRAPAGQAMLAGAPRYFMALLTHKQISINALFASSQLN